MNTRIRSLAKLIVAAVFCCTSAAALAMPKAAEHENAEVTSGVDAARPKHSSAKPSPVTSKAKPVKKTSKPSSSPQKPKGTKTRK